MVAAESSTVCSSTLSASRAPETWLSAARRLGAMEFAAETGGDGLSISILISGARADRGLGTVARQSLWNILIDRADLGALRVELRVVLIGAHQRGLDGIGQGRAGNLHQKECRQRGSGKNPRAAAARGWL